ncbi:MAG: FMN-binding protein, partial [Erysipelotrichaceae bacterium]|nr:FMN-binding protein [Erysipelotrichaceae bacterium]
MKKFFMILLAGLMAVSVAACSTKTTEEKIYTAGTYTATAAGFGGDVTVTLTVSETAITAVEIVGDAETAAIGGAALETLATAIKEANSAEVDVVSGATVTSNAVVAAATKAWNEAKGVAPSKTALTDG